MRTAQRILRSKVFIALSFLVVGHILFLAIFSLRCRSAQPAFVKVPHEIPANIQQAEAGIKDYKRAQESTYLTFPEWYLVFNPQEYGQFIAKEKPSSFPYFTSISQFWGSYCQVYGIGSRNYPFNAGNHLMETVIGSSFSVEYTLKGVWENSIGRAAEWLGGTQTPEDAYAAAVAQEYGKFLPAQPWYLFPFGAKLQGLWKDTPLWGPHNLRKWERKTFLTLEYGTKAVYGWLIEKATHTIYGTAATEVYAAVQSAPSSIFKDKQVRLVKNLGNDTYIITVPHYQGFTDTIPILAQAGVQFIDVAGNDEILLTAVAPADWKYNLPTGHLLFEMKMMTSDAKRIAVQAPVKSLGSIIVSLQQEGVTLEHLYDY